MSKVKIYDFLGNLTVKLGVDLDLVDSEAFLIKEIIQDEKTIANLALGFKYLACKSRLWVNVKEGTNLDNVLVLKEDFEMGKTLKIQLNKRLTIQLTQSEKFNESLISNEMSIKVLINKLYQFENVKSDLKSKNLQERNLMTKKLLGLTLNSIYYYKSMVRKAKAKGFDFELNLDNHANQLRQFVSDKR